MKLRVLEAWDEPHSGDTDGDQPEFSLHYEGRAVKVTASDGDAGKLTRISALAICTGIDAAMHNGREIIIKKYKCRRLG